MAVDPKEIPGDELPVEPPAPSEPAPAPASDPVGDAPAPDPWETKYNELEARIASLDFTPSVLAALIEELDDIEEDDLTPRGETIITDEPEVPETIPSERVKRHAGAWW